MHYTFVSLLDVTATFTQTEMLILENSHLHSQVLLLFTTRRRRKKKQKLLLGGEASKEVLWFYTVEMFGSLRALLLKMENLNNSWSSLDL